MQFLEEDPELTDRIEQIVRAKLMPDEFDAPEDTKEEKAKDKKKEKLI